MLDKKTLWERYTEEQMHQMEQTCAEYRDFLDRGKTERECVDLSIRMAEEAGYQPLQEAIRQGRRLAAGDKVYACYNNKTLALYHIGTDPIEKGMNILGAHIDSPRIDVKQNPLYESRGFAYLDTHYYGGIKKYQWVTIPLAIHGVVIRKDGTSVQVVIGEDPADPVFCISDLLIHLSQQQLTKTASKVIEGEGLDLLVGSIPQTWDEDDAKAGQAAHDSDGGETGTDGDQACRKGDDSADFKDDETRLPEEEKALRKTPIKAAVLGILKEKYDMDEEDFLSAELEIVPADKAREMGFDRSMILSYGQDDRICAFTSLKAMLSIGAPAVAGEGTSDLAANGKGAPDLAAAGEGAPAPASAPARTACCLLVDKEEIGSMGASGMQSRFFENMTAEVLALMGYPGALSLRRTLQNSTMLSSDVSAGFDPLYADVFEPKNAAFLGKGIVFNKFTGARGKSGSNDANPEYMAAIRRILDQEDVQLQTAELGKVDAGGGGTIAFIMANYGMEVIDCGLAVLSMHAPLEVSSKADIYEAVRGYQAFLKHMTNIYDA